MLWNKNKVELSELCCAAKYRSFRRRLTAVWSLITFYLFYNIITETILSFMTKTSFFLLISQPAPFTLLKQINEISCSTFTRVAQQCHPPPHPPTPSPPPAAKKSWLSHEFFFLPLSVADRSVLWYVFQGRAYPGKRKDQKLSSGEHLSVCDTRPSVLRSQPPPSASSPVLQFHISDGILMMDSLITVKQKRKTKKGEKLTSDPHQLLFTLKLCKLKDCP